MIDKPTQERMKEGVLDEGLENHSTQGSHGVNYHHPEQGDTGYQFFMPSREFRVTAWLGSTFPLPRSIKRTLGLSPCSQLHGEEFFGRSKSTD